MDFGYKRVLTIEQTTDRQLAGAKLDKEFDGSVKSRPQLDALLDQVRSDDIIHIIDRIARNLLELIETITSSGVTLRFYKEFMTFTGDDSHLQRLLRQIMDSVVEIERFMINERTAEGRAIAMSKGIKFGRKPNLIAKKMAQIRQEHALGKSVSAIAIDHDVSRQRIYSATSAK